jgi:hypothetical protein
LFCTFGAGVANAVNWLGYRLECPGLNNPSRLAPPTTQLRMQWVRGPLPGVKWSGRETDHSFLYNTKVKIEARAAVTLETERAKGPNP